MNKQPIQNNPFIAGFLAFLAFLVVCNAFAAMYLDSGIMVNIAVIPLALVGSVILTSLLYTGGN